MKSPRIVFEIHYTAILNFSSIYRDVLNPFAQLCANNVHVRNENRLQETVSFHFKEDGFKVECSLDRLSLITDGEVDQLFSSGTSAIRVVFDIFDKIQSLDSFTSVISCSLFADFLQIRSEKKTDVLALFSNKFFNPESQSLLEANTFFTINLNNKQGTRTENLTLETVDYNYISFQKAVFFPLDDSHVIEYKDKYGFHYAIQLSDTEVKPDYRGLKELYIAVKKRYKELSDYADQ